MYCISPSCIKLLKPIYIDINLKELLEITTIKFPCLFTSNNLPCKQIGYLNSEPILAKTMSHFFIIKTSSTQQTIWISFKKSCFRYETLNKHLERFQKSIALTILVQCREHEFFVKFKNLLKNFIFTFINTKFENPTLTL